MPPLIPTRSFFVSPAAPQLYHGHSQPAISQTPFAISHQLCILRPLQPSSALCLPPSVFRPPPSVPLLPCPSTPLLPCLLLHVSRLHSPYGPSPNSLRQHLQEFVVVLAGAAVLPGGLGRRHFSQHSAPLRSRRSALGSSRQRFPTATANLYPYPCRLSSLGARRSVASFRNSQFAITTVRLRSLVETATAVLTKRYGSQWLVST